MDRTGSIFRWPQRRKPHARGDGPIVSDTDGAELSVNPTHVGMDRSAAACRMVSSAVNPTHVGMDRLALASCALASGKPHARGDGPIIRERWDIEVEVNPTHVGMDRRTFHNGRPR